SYIPISIAHISTFPPCLATLMASSNENTDLPLPDTPNNTYMLPLMYSPTDEYFDFHTLNDSPSLRRSYSSRNLSTPDFISVPILSRTLVLILTDSRYSGNHFSTNSLPSNSLSFRSYSPDSCTSIIAFLAANPLTRLVSHA